MARSAGYTSRVIPVEQFESRIAAPGVGVGRRQHLQAGAAGELPGPAWGECDLELPGNPAGGEVPPVVWA